MADDAIRYGYVLVYRNIYNSLIWASKEPFDARSAWIDLLLMVNHADSRILFDGEIVTVKRGQHITSITALSERWKWSWKKTKKFLKILETDGMISVNGTTHGITITLINYGKYQDAGRTNGRNDGEPRANRGRTMSDKQRMIKNDKNEKRKIAPDGGASGRVAEADAGDGEAPLPNGIEEMTDEEQAAELGVTLEQWRERFRPDE